MNRSAGAAPLYVPAALNLRLGDPLSAQELPIKPRFNASPDGAGRRTGLPMDGCPQVCAY